MCESTNTRVKVGDTIEITAAATSLCSSSTYNTGDHMRVTHVYWDGDVDAKRLTCGGEDQVEHYLLNTEFKVVA